MEAKPICIGRQEENDIVLADDSVSRRHARLTPMSDGRYLVEDLESTNGTFIRDGHEWLPVTRAYLERGGIIMLGDYSTSVMELLSDEEIPGQVRKIAFPINGAARSAPPLHGAGERMPALGAANPPMNEFGPAARIGIYPDRAMSIRPNPPARRPLWRSLLLWAGLGTAVALLAGAGAAGYFYVVNVALV